MPNTRIADTLAVDLPHARRLLRALFGYASPQDVPPAGADNPNDDKVFWDAHDAVFGSRGGGDAEGSRFWYNLGSQYWRKDRRRDALPVMPAALRDFILSSPRPSYPEIDSFFRTTASSWWKDDGSPHGRSLAASSPPAEDVLLLGEGGGWAGLDSHNIGPGSNRSSSGSGKGKRRKRDDGSGGVGDDEQRDATLPVASGS
ncbi:hypothetical protein JCM10213_001380, partial [Rhodosporidiobolus nylandii]